MPDVAHKPRIARAHGPGNVALPLGLSGGRAHQRAVSCEAVAAYAGLGQRGMEDPHT
ncbi:hypothetical protein [Herbidospora daliensis]|uniref:hypothetical protein n=1 Tax=Herbidospora daliensis TaxID=295585 RepID=UPI0012FB24D1|nr:hypothetical protein [Herbidospora daliensis]